MFVTAVLGLRFDDVLHEENCRRLVGSWNVAPVPPGIFEVKSSKIINMYR